MQLITPIKSSVLQASITVACETPPPVWNGSDSSFNEEQKKKTHN